MPIAAAAVLGGANLLGGYLGGESAKSAARTAADAQLEAARIAAAEARLAASQSMGQFNVRQGGSGAAQGSYGNLYNNNRYR
jgi:hypothetical protein